MEIWREKEKRVPEKMTGVSPVEHSFKNKGTAKTQRAFPLAPILLVQNSTEIRVARVEMIAAAIGTCKGSLNWSWEYSGKTL